MRTTLPTLTLGGIETHFTVDKSEKFGRKSLQNKEKTAFT